jgi:hypothetical protein
LAGGDRHAGNFAARRRHPSRQEGHHRGMEITLKNKCCLYVIIPIRFFSVTICNLLIDFLSYNKVSFHVSRKNIVHCAALYSCEDLC